MIEGHTKRYSYNTTTTYSYVDPLNLQIKNTCQNISNNSKKSAIKIPDIICKQKGGLIYQIFIYTKTFVHASNVGKLDWNECANNVSAFDNNVLRERLYANWSVTECIKTLLLF